MAIYDWREAKSRCEPAEAAALAVDAAWSGLYDDLMDAERDLAEARRLLALAEAVIGASRGGDELRRSRRLHDAIAAWDRRNETSGRSTLGEVEQSSGSAPPPESAGERAIGHDPLADRVPGESANLGALRAVAVAARTAAEQVAGLAAAGLLRLAEALETGSGRAEAPDTPTAAPDPETRS